jgi:hypothetical protein
MTMVELVAKRCIGKASRRNPGRLEANAARSGDHEVFPTFGSSVWAKHG